MDEKEWPACGRPDAMLRFLRQFGRRHAPRRKLRLFMCGCCRLGWEFLTAPVARHVVEVAERFADGRATVQERDGTRDVLTASRWSHPQAVVESKHSLPYLAAVGESQLWDAVQQSAASVVLLRVAAKLGPDAHQRQGSEWKRSQGEQRAVLAALVREVFGNPFCPVAFDPAWRTPTVLSLAEAAYENRELPSGHLDLQHLAVLADALEETGCTDAPLLEHLRGPGPHVRGCAALDAVLGQL